MEIEIDYTIITHEEFEKRINECIELKAKLFVDWLKNEINKDSNE